MISYNSFRNKAINLLNLGQLSLGEERVLLLAYGGEIPDADLNPIQRNSRRNFPAKSADIPVWAYRRRLQWINIFRRLTDHYSNDPARFGDMRDRMNLHRRVRIRLISGLLTNPSLRACLSPSGITVENAIFDEPMELDFVEADIRLGFLFCQFRQGFTARSARLGRLCLRGSKFHPSGADSHDGRAAESVAIMLGGAHILGDLDMDSQMIPSGRPMAYWDAEPFGIFEARGLVRADGVHVGGRLTARRAIFRGMGSTDSASARSPGTPPEDTLASLVRGGVRLNQARIDLDALFDNATFEGCRLNFRGGQVKGNVVFDGARFDSTWPIRDGATVYAKPLRALDLREAKIGADLSLDRVVNRRGCIDASRSLIDGSFFATRCQLRHEDLRQQVSKQGRWGEFPREALLYYSLIADGAVVKHDLRIEQSALEGGVAIDDAQINGYLKFIGVCLNQAAAGAAQSDGLPLPLGTSWPLQYAIHADRIRVNDDVQFGLRSSDPPLLACIDQKSPHHCTVFGKTSMRWAQIGGHLNLDAIESRGSPMVGNAFSASNSRIRGDLKVSRESSFLGSVRFIGAEIRGDAKFEGATFDMGGDRDALSMRGAVIQGDLRVGWKSERRDDTHPNADLRFKANGTVSFADAHVIGRVNVSAITAATAPLPSVAPRARDGRRENGPSDHAHARYKHERRPVPSAISFRNARLDGDVRFHPGCRILGRVSFTGATLGGNLVMRGGYYCVRSRRDHIDEHLVDSGNSVPWEPRVPSIDPYHDDTIRLVSSTIKGRVFLGIDESGLSGQPRASDSTMKVIGRISMNQSTITGWLKFGNIRVCGVPYISDTDPGKRRVWSFTASGATLHAGLFAVGSNDPGLPAQFVGEFRVRRATVYHEMSFGNVQFFAAPSVPVNEKVVVDGMKIRRDSVLGEEICITRLRRKKWIGASERVELPVAPARTRAQDWSLVNLARTEVVGVIRFKPSVEFMVDRMLKPSVLDGSETDPKGSPLDICWIRLDRLKVRGRLEWYPGSMPRDSGAVAATDSSTQSGSSHRIAELDRIARERKLFGLMLNNAEIEDFDNHINSWPEQDHLSISGFSYRRMVIQRNADPHSATTGLLRITETARYLEWARLHYSVSARQPSARFGGARPFGHIRLKFSVLVAYLILLASSVPISIFLGYSSYLQRLIWSPLLAAVLIGAVGLYALVFLTKLPRKSGVKETGYDSQPLEQLALMYRRIGSSREFKHAVYEKTKLQCKVSGHRSIQKIRKAALYFLGTREYRRTVRGGDLEPGLRFLAYDYTKTAYDFTRAVGEALVVGCILYPLWRLSSRYGTSAAPALLMLLLLWVSGSIVFEKGGLFDGTSGARSAIVAPNDPYTYLYAPEEYPSFSSWVFSADNVLPIIELGSTNHWVVNRAAGRAFSDQPELKKVWFPHRRVAESGKTGALSDGINIALQGWQRLRDFPVASIKSLTGFTPKHLRGYLRAEGLSSGEFRSSGGHGERKGIDDSAQNPVQSPEGLLGRVISQAFEAMEESPPAWTDTYRRTHAGDIREADSEIEAHDRYIPPGQLPATMLHFSWRDYDEPTPMARWLMGFQKVQIVLGWMLTTIAVLGYTGLIRRD